MKYRVSREMRLSCLEEQSFKNSRHCWVCRKQFTLIDQVAHNDPPVRDHCHYTGKYRGAAHNSCNLRIRRTRTIPVLFHNFTNYDNHLFVRSLGKIEGDINVIARNDEKHISVTKEICVSEKSKWKLRFSDTSSFMLVSLALHVSNLRSVGVENFKITKKFFPEEGKFEKVTRKGVFPCEWMMHVGCLSQTELPSKKEFFSHLNLEKVTDEDYACAEDVWKTFSTSSMREYHDLYLKTDTLLLADLSVSRQTSETWPSKNSKLTRAIT